MGAEGDGGLVGGSGAVEGVWCGILSGGGIGTECFLYLEEKFVRGYRLVWP